MSDYVRKKVIRYPLNLWMDERGIEDYYDLEEYFEGLGNIPVGFYNSKINSFTIDSGYNSKTKTTNYYLDYLLNYDYGSEMGDYGISFTLLSKQKNKWEKEFNKIIDNIDKDKLRLVEFCYYNGCDCPDYYEVTPKEKLTDDEQWIL